MSERENKINREKIKRKWRKGKWVVNKDGKWMWVEKN